MDCFNQPSYYIDEKTYKLHQKYLTSLSAYIAKRIVTELDVPYEEESGIGDLIEAILQGRKTERYDLPDKKSFADADGNFPYTRRIRSTKL